MIKRSIIILLSLIIISQVFSEDDYLQNTYYAPKVEKIINNLLMNPLVERVDVLNADEPFFFTPDLFELRIFLKNNDILLLKHVPESLNIYKKDTSIAMLNETSFFSVKKIKNKSFSTASISIKDLSYLLEIEIKNLNDFLESYQRIKTTLLSLPSFGNADQIRINKNGESCSFWIICN